MSDNGMTTEGMPTSQPETPAPAAPVDDPLATPPEDQAVFPRSYVEKVRGEAQRYREQASAANTQLQSYNDVFGVYPDEDRQAWFQLARDWAQDPNRAATVMQQIAQNVLGEPHPDESAQAPGVAPTFDEAMQQALSPEEVRQMIDEQFAARDASVAEQRAIDGIFGEVRAAGYDPETAEGFAVLYNANHFTGGDIPKAVEMIRERDQRIINDFVAGRRGRPLASPSGGVVATPESPPITNIEDARRATDAFLRERRGAS